MAKKPRTVSTPSSKTERTRRLLRKAIVVCGGQAQLAAACGWSQQAISKAAMTGVVSAELALAIHKATAGEVLCAALRPDLWRQSENLSPALDS